MKRFPWVLSLATGLAFAVLVALGVWQVRRLAWKEGLLVHIAALRTAPARPIAAALADVARGRDGDFARVAASCGPPPAGPQIFRYALDQEVVGWRLIAACGVAAPPYDGVLVDRGLVDTLTGAMAPRAIAAPPLGRVIGILRAPGASALLGAAAPEREGRVVTLRLIDRAALRAAARLAGLVSPAPLLLQAEQETPPAPGLSPSALPTDIPNNHLVYAVTWFALAGILLWFYAALLLRRRRGG